MLNATLKVVMLDTIKMYINACLTSPGNIGRDSSGVYQSQVNTSTNSGDTRPVPYLRSSSLFTIN
jgi:hypothetical protein